MIQLVADDIGADPEIDRAAIVLARRRLLASAAVMVNGRMSPEVCELLVESSVCCGLHLNVSSGRPVSRKDPKSDLHQSFPTPTTAARKTSDIATAIDAFISSVQDLYAESFIREEIQAQYERYVDLFQTPPTFMSVHHDLDRNPWFQDILLDTLPAYRGRQQRLIDGYLDNYVELFVRLGESELQYSRRVYELFESNSEPSIKSLFAFHPAADLPDMNFTVYQEGRIIEFRFLLRELPRLLRTFGPTYAEGSWN